MKIVFWVLTLQASSFAGAFYTLGHIKAKANSSTQEEAVSELIKRVVPSHADKFIVSVNKSVGQYGKDAFYLHKQKNGTIKITATTGVAAASGFHHYIKYYCKGHISWHLSQLNLTDNMPNVSIKITFNDKFRYYQNVCTTSYSFVWWDWQQWEKHIDWMAMNSFNLVLAFNGQEAIWEKVYKNLNLTNREIAEHFTGPAFLSWNRMGNVRGWGGPLSKSWHLRSVTLQKQILKRFKELGIVSVLPAFSGNVPRAFKRLFPKAKLHQMTAWNNFNDTYCCPYLLDPTEKLFKTVGKMFLQELTREFGTDHVYNCDTFNEMVPFTSNTSYLKQIGMSIYSAMTAVDPKAIWMMQGWLFHHEFFYWSKPRAEALLTSVPLGKMIILDLQSEQFPQYDRFDSYFGQPYIWCMLHNFGGTLGMFGSSDIINQRVFEARKANGSTLIGTGITPEGLNPNYVVYDLMSEMAWRKVPTNLSTWFSSYATRRYGLPNEKAVEAWLIMQKTVYNFTGTGLIRGKFAYNRSPRTKIQTWTWYNNCELLEAWDCLLNASTEMHNVSTYSYDLVDLTRQILQNFGDEYFNKMKSAFQKKKVDDFQRAAGKFLEVFDDAESILATNQYFLLGPWLNDAKKAANSSGEEKLYEYNARNQITLWGPNGEIKDYANKQWSGIVSDYFKPRWKLFINAMNDSLVNQRPFKESKVVQDVFKKVEEPFTFDRTSFPDQPKGKTVEIARRIHTRWRRRGHCRVQSSQKHLNPESHRNDQAHTIIVD